MALQAASIRLAAAIPIASRTFASTRISICSTCLKRLQRQQRLSTTPDPTPRRGLATATAHRPETLNPDPPPRNAGIPDISIAGGDPRVDSPPYPSSSSSVFRPKPEPQEADQQQPIAEPSESSRISLPEVEAQQPRPTGQSQAIGSLASSAPQGSTQRMSKLRPRKAAMSLSSTAVQHLRALLELPDPKMIRVGVKNRGCSGLAYHLEYVDQAGKFDEAVEQDGVRVLIDSKALFSIIGSEMDWIEDKLSARFIFKNPNISKSAKQDSFMWVRSS